MNFPTINLWMLPVGVFATSVVIVAVMLWQRRQRRLRRVRPPVSGKLLRPAGHTLALKLEKLDEKLLTSLGMAMGAGAVLAFLLTTLGSIVANEQIHAHVAANGLLSLVLSPRVLPGLLSLGLLTLGSFLVFLYGALKCNATLNESRNVHLGLRGEQAVAEALSEVASNGYRAFHDFPGGEEWNIDHVVVGPGGVFAIETKTRSKRKVAPGVRDYVVCYDGTKLQFPWGTDEKAVGQAKANARHLAAFLSKATGMEVRVDPLLVVPGWYVEATSKHSVRAMPETALPKVLKGLPRILTDQHIRQVAHQIDQKCRDVEF